MTTSSWRYFRFILVVGLVSGIVAWSLRVGVVVLLALMVVDILIMRIKGTL